VELTDVAGVEHGERVDEVLSFGEPVVGLLPWLKHGFVGPVVDNFDLLGCELVAAQAQEPFTHRRPQRNDPSRISQ